MGTCLQYNLIFPESVTIKPISKISFPKLPTYQLLLNPGSNSYNAYIVKVEPKAWLPFKPGSLIKSLFMGIRLPVLLMIYLIGIRGLLMLFIHSFELCEEGKMGKP